MAVIILCILSYALYFIETEHRAALKRLERLKNNPNNGRVIDATKRHSIFIIKPNQ